MKKHNYWGKIEKDWAGFSGEILFKSAHFDNKEITVFLGNEFDEDGKEIEAFPTDNELTDFEKTYLHFLSHLGDIIKEIKERTFERYLKVYAHYYENEEKSGQIPLHLDSKEKHFETIKSIINFRVLKNRTIKISIGY
ncbi:hypothetical protein [Aquimarina sp. SS2-1]|uniref:hypothetical protein n=1 Tax=Aquimarina besae TaxID=3342247 RepID=UPI00366DEE62